MSEAGGSVAASPGSNPPAAQVDVSFEGWFLVRLTTDPDPTDDPRGVTGYTLAVAGEPDLDSWIRLNPPPELLREPALTMSRLGTMRVGVTVTAVEVVGAELPQAQQLVGGTVELLSDPNRGNPAYIGRNDLIGTDDDIAFPIDPFILQLRAPGSDPAIVVTRADVLPEPGPLWVLPREVWAYRIGNADPSGDGDAYPSMEVMNAINVYDQYEYFRDRRRYLEGVLAEETDEARREGLRTRLHAIEFFGERIRSRLWLKRMWSFSIQRSTAVVSGLPGVDLDSPWPVKFWMGGYDGDLMMGYLRGSLSIPLLASSPSSATGRG